MCLAKITREDKEYLDVLRMSYNMAYEMYNYYSSHSLYSQLNQILQKEINTKIIYLLLEIYCINLYLFYFAEYFTYSTFGFLYFIHYSNEKFFKLYLYFVSKYKSQISL